MPLDEGGTLHVRGGFDQRVEAGTGFLENSAVLLRYHRSAPPPTTKVSTARVNSMPKNDFMLLVMRECSRLGEW